MSAPSQGPYSSGDDLETTADYPPLAAAAPADTWVIPSRENAEGVDDPLRAYQEQIRALRESVAGITLVRDQLHSDLSAKRHELEELLLTRDTLLSRHERELSSREDQIGALRESLAAAAAERDRLQAELGALASEREQAQSASAPLEAQRAVPEGLFAAHDQRVAELTQELSERSHQQFLLVAERDDLRARLERARSDLTGLAQRRERQTSAEAHTEREHARREVALARDDMTELQRRVTAHREALQRAEARRQVFESMLRDREDLLDERDTRLRALQDELARKREAPADLVHLPAAVAGGVPNGSSELDATGADAKQRLAAAEAELAEVRGALESLQSELTSARESNGALRAELAAAEQQRSEAGGELRNTRVRLAQLEEAADPVSAAPATRRLLVRTAGDKGIVHLLGRRTTIGRVPSNDVCIDAEMISRHHAAVLVTDAGLAVVEDLNSTNGVFVNDVRVARQELHEGDVITFGATSFRYVLKRDATPA